MLMSFFIFGFNSVSSLVLVSVWVLDVQVRAIFFVFCFTFLLVVVFDVLARNASFVFFYMCFTRSTAIRSTAAYINCPKLPDEIV